jgi:hypothetical protein
MYSLYVFTFSLFVTSVRSKEIETAFLALMEEDVRTATMVSKVRMVFRNRR